MAVVRISGPQALEYATHIFEPAGTNKEEEWTPESHRVYFGRAVHPTSRILLDECLLFAMKAPRSYTREDVVEIQTHGSETGVVAARVLDALFELGARRAEPGEFTLRAYVNGRIDLMQAESIGMLVSAQTAEAADVALGALVDERSSSDSSAGSSFAADMTRARDACLDALASLEASTDFAEDDIPDLLSDEEVLSMIKRDVHEPIARALETRRAGELLRAGARVALCGRVNAGQSSLLNALSESDAAIVADVPGTTRDVVSAVSSLGGVPVTFLDTAGLRSDSQGVADGAQVDDIERQGMQRSARAAATCDAVLFVVDSDAGFGAEDDVAWRALVGGGGIVASSTSDSSNGDSKMRLAVPTILVYNKIDVAAPSNRHPDEASFDRVVEVSATTGKGLDDLREGVRAVLSPKATNVGWAVSERQAEALIRARVAADAFLSDAHAGVPIDVLVPHVRDAASALLEITGVRRRARARLGHHGSAEEELVEEELEEAVLSRLFSTYCVGK